MIIRLIDIVLIVLFGFIVISDIDIKTALPLPSKGKPQSESVERKVKIPVYVEIDAQSRFWVFQNNQKKVRRSSISSLEVYLQDLRQKIRKVEKRDMAVILRPHEMSPIQKTVDVLDLCERNRISKNIARRSLALF